MAEVEWEFTLADDYLHHALFIECTLNGSIVFEYQSRMSMFCYKNIDSLELETITLFRPSERGSFELRRRTSEQGFRMQVFPSSEVRLQMYLPQEFGEKLWQKLKEVCINN